VKAMKNDVEIVRGDFVFEVSKPSPLVKSQKKYPPEFPSPSVKRRKIE
jgi:hypothetical protein